MIPRQLPRAFLPLRSRNYALFWIGYLAANAGKWVELTGAVWLVYQLSESPLLLGLVGIARAIPTIAISPIAGVIADRANQRYLLLWTQGLSLVTSMAIPFLFVFGFIDLWLVYVQIMVQATISAFDAAVRQALFPKLVSRSELSDAVTMTAGAALMAKVVGPLAAGFAIAALGEASPFIINAVTAVVLFVAVVAMRGVAGGAGSSSTFRGDLAEGFRYIWSDGVLNALLKLEIVYGLLQMNSVMITIFALEVFRVGPEAMGALLAAPAIGAVAGVGLMMVVGHPRYPGRLAITATLGYAAVLVSFAFVPYYPIAFGLLVVIGLLDSVETVIRLAIVQLATPERLRGRTMANFGTVTRGTSPLADAQSGTLADLLGPPLAVTVAAIGLAINCVAVLRRGQFWNFQSRPDAAIIIDKERPAAK